MSQNRFLAPEMTPRAWRMLAYCAAGFFLYGFISVLELAQEIQLRRIDEQLRMVTLEEMRQGEPGL